MASSCGKEYCPDTKCGLRHPFNGGKRARCERIKGCQNSICAPFMGLGAHGFVLYDTCLQQCHLNEDDTNYPAAFGDYQSYLCQLYAPEDIMEYYQVNPCGADPAATASAQKEASRQQIAASNNIMILGIGAILLVALLLLFFKKR